MKRDTWTSLLGILGCGLVMVGCRVDAPDALYACFEGTCPRGQTCGADDLCYIFPEDAPKRGRDAGSRDNADSAVQNRTATPGDNAPGDEMPGNDETPGSTSDHDSDAGGASCIRDVGMPCGECGGVRICNGNCNTTTPVDLGAACGHCGGTRQCDRSCSKPDRVDLGHACGRCGGTLQCDGTCSVITPDNLEQPCNTCDGHWQCDGSCPLPPDYNQSASQTVTKSAGFTLGGSTGKGSGIDEQDPVYFGACPAGYTRDGAAPVTAAENGNGHCEGAWLTDNPHDCTIRVHMGASVLEGNVNCKMTIAYRRTCD